MSYTAEDEKFLKFSFALDGVMADASISDTAKLGDITAWASRLCHNKIDSWTVAMGVMALAGVDDATLLKMDNIVRPTLTDG